MVVKKDSTKPAWLHLHISVEVIDMTMILLIHVLCCFSMVFFLLYVYLAIVYNFIMKYSMVLLLNTCTYTINMVFVNKRPLLIMGFMSFTVIIMKVTSAFVLLLSFLNFFHCTTVPQHTDVVLFGALGDLSRKYLWQSFFQLYLEEQNENKTFSFYGISRDAQKEGSQKLTKLLDDVNCEGDISSVCGLKLFEFRQLVTYVQLKTDEQFDSFGKHKLKNIPENSDFVLGRIFYLAIPPNVYSSVAARLSSCCKLKISHAWSRLVLEKPFGSELQSALSMARDIGKHFKEEEIYRVDHYLAKSVVRQILPFR